MTRGEMLTARMIVADASETVPDAVLSQSRAAGWDEAAIEAMKARGWGTFARTIDRAGSWRCRPLFRRAGGAGLQAQGFFQTGDFLKVA